MYAPIALFCYKRLDSLETVVDALRKNNLAPKTKLYIYSDAPKYPKDEELVNNVRRYISSISGFEEISIEYAPFNKGLAKSIIDGVSSLLSRYNRVIVLEDDLSVSTNFLQFMNNALEFYEYEKRVFSITGFSTGIKPDSDVDVFFTKRSSSWGWATWKDRWEKIDWNVSDYQEFKYNIISRLKFNRMGSDMSTMLDKQIHGKINSWAIRWCYHQFKYDLFSVHPFVSKVENIGFNDVHATHTKEKVNRFTTNLDCSNKLTFKFDSKIQLDKYIIKQFVRPYSLKQRIVFKMINFLNK